MHLGVATSECRHLAVSISVSRKSVLISPTQFTFASLSLCLLITLIIQLSSPLCTAPFVEVVITVCNLSTRSGINILL